MTLAIGEPSGDWVAAWGPDKEGEALKQRALDALARADEFHLLDTNGAGPPGDSLGQSEALTLLAEGARKVSERLGSETKLDRKELTALAELLVELENVRHDLYLTESEQRLAALTTIQAGLARLRGVTSSADMLEKATEEVCDACGFDRSILFRVQDGQLVIQSVFYRGDDEGAQRLLEVGQESPAKLDHMLLETEMMRRRKPMLVLDAQNESRVYREIAEESGSVSYVAAPIMPEGRVIGFIHCDCFFQKRLMTPFDRDKLWVFCEGFGYAYERTVLMERLRSQRDRVRQMVGSTEQVMNELCDAELEVARLDDADSGDSARAAAVLAAPERSRLDDLLTRREIEVIRLMARGETNAGIASRLVISQGTVKSHVKHVLRKLRAANRAEAVSRYLRITGDGIAGGPR